MELRIMVNNVVLPYFFLFVVNLLFGPAYSAYTQPAATMQSANQGSEYVPLQVLDQYPKCFDVGWRSQQAESRDCLRAIMMLPTTDDSGEFNSDSGIPNQFLLPVTKVHKTCNVTISILHGLRDECSWTTIAGVAGRLVQTCSSGYYPNGNSGGYTYVGRKSHIRVVMGRVGLILSENNTTDSSGGSATA